MAKEQFQSVRGMPDVLPADQSVHNHITSTLARLAAQAGYGQITTPILEDSGLFLRTVGEATDIVEKEMYVFADRSDNQLALRPELTAPVARAFIQHGMGSWPQPVRLYYTGPVFRYDRPQAGRQRQHNQVGVEVFGDELPSVDVEVILLLNRLYHQLGLVGVTLQLNSIGDNVCRPKFKKALLDYLQPQADKLCETCRNRLDKNPLRVLDCKQPGCAAVLVDAPQTLNHLCRACQTHFAGVLEYLDDLGVPYELNHLLVRGLDYYNRTVFEFYGSREGAQAALGGGGRYDGLVQQIGGQAVPAVGWGSGVERIALELAATAAAEPAQLTTPVYVAALGEPARLSAFRLTQQLLDAGVGATSNVDKTSIQAQLSRASRLGVPYAAIIGQKEVFDGTVILRDMTTGAQETIPYEKFVAELKKRFI